MFVLCYVRERAIENTKKNMPGETSPTDLSISEQSNSDSEPSAWTCTLLKKRKRLVAKLSFQERCLQLVVDHSKKNKNAESKPKIETIEFCFDLIASIEVLQQETGVDSKQTYGETVCCRPGGGPLFELDDEVVIKLVYYDPELKKKKTKKKVPKELLLIIEQSQDFEENLELANKLKTKVINAITTGKYYACF